MIEPEASQCLGDWWLLTQHNFPHAHFTFEKKRMIALVPSLNGF